MTSANKVKAKTSKWRMALWLLGLFLLIVLLYFLFNYERMRDEAGIGTAYAARIICSCHYIGRRDAESCKTDLEDNMGAIGITIDSEKRRVSASLPLLATRIAEFREGWGCALVDEEEIETEQAAD